jgi:hypothetical protein
LWGLNRKTVVRLAVTAAFVSTVTIALVYFAAPDEGNVLYSLLNNQDKDRFVSIAGGFLLFLSNPVFGAGLGVFVHDYAARTGDFLPIHSTSAWLLAEYGIIGFAIIFGGAAYAAFMSFKGALSGNRADRFVFLALSVFGTMSLVHEMLYQRTLWLLLGVALAAHGTFWAIPKASVDVGTTGEKAR